MVSRNRNPVMMMPPITVTTVNAMPRTVAAKRRCVQRFGAGMHETTASTATATRATCGHHMRSLLTSSISHWTASSRAIMTVAARTTRPVTAVSGDDGMEVRVLSWW